MLHDEASLKRIFDLALKNHKENNLNDAEKLYLDALEINPLHFDSIFQLASLCAFKKDYVKAKQFLKKAIQIKPDHASSHNNLGGLFFKEGNYYEALVSFQRATEVDSKNVNAKNNLTALLRSLEIKEINKIKGTNLKKLYLFLFRRNDIYHEDIFINAKLTLFSEKKYEKLEKNLNFNSPILNEPDIKDFLREELLILMLQKSLTTDFFLEKILTKLRSEILFNFFNSKKDILLENLKFVLSLSIQCFYNEYVFFQTKEEEKNIKRLKDEIIKKKKIEEIEIAILGSYLPLLSVKEVEKKLFDYKSKNSLFNDLLTIQIKEPLIEKKLKNSIKTLGKISNMISKKVRDQYEENPYPRWRFTYERLPVPFLARFKNQIKPNQIKIENNFEYPKILIAGCGTGHHACIAQDYINSKILCVDLSLSSLAYAKRKTNELGFNNIEYLNTDILELHKLKKKFDVIECIGVLHHMKNPLEGLKILLDLLESNGLIKLGLYSEKAREHIIEVRNFIGKNNFGTSIEDIRESRMKIFNKKKDRMFNKIINRRDFYSTSTARDLMFHIQEESFTIPQISKILSDFNLEFLGFSNEIIKNEYSKVFPDDARNISLENWNNFEISEPDTFIGMYNFWLRKKK